MSVATSDDVKVIFSEHNDHEEARSLFYSLLPQGGKVCEVGVYAGKNSQRILSNNKPSKLFLVDLWKSFSGEDGQLDHSQATFDRALDQVKASFDNNPDVDIIVGDATETAATFEDEYFDWVYIDASHDYKSVYDQLNVWYPKVKKGGYLAGHDYSLRDNQQKKWGVSRAVNQFCAENNLQINILNNSSAQDYAIKV